MAATHKTDFDAAAIFELFGLRHSTEGGQISVTEGKNTARGKVRVSVTPSNNDPAISLTPNEARYIADRLLLCAAKAERKAAAPCGSCGKP